MKIPLKWLADYVSVDLPIAELARRLTLAGLEVAAFRSYGLPAPEGLAVKQDEPGPVWEPDKIVTAQVLRIEKHPNADKLKLVTVDHGAAAPKTVVTGAPNIHVGEAGMKVILGLAGTRYWDGHVQPRQIAELKPKALRGIMNDAMCMSEFELGISEEHEGIILLEEDAPIGVPLADFMGDIALEIDVLPNMARCLSMTGIAREVAALCGTTMKPPPTAVEATGPDIAGRVRVLIEDADLSPRYAAGLIEGVTVGPAPGWMQRRLSLAGMRPINNIVDVTNYVMLEWGQPLHAFDYDALKERAGGKAPTIIVRPARAGEVLRTLDAVVRQLTPDMLVIADEAGPIALAGVMGGAETEVSKTTRNILLESANFDFRSIRRTSRGLDLISEASQRFSKGIHPEMVPLALARASELMRRHAGGAVARGIVDAYPRPLSRRVVELPMAEVRRLLGADVPIAECERILQALEFDVQRRGDEALAATVPPHRLDIQDGPADLIEDIARLHGYDRLPATLLREPLPEQHGNADADFEERLRDRLVTLGLQEIISYSLTTPEREAPLGLPELEYVRLLNPISSDRVVLRHSVLSGVLEALANNLRHTDDVRLFEVGSVYLPIQGQKLPDEPRRLAIALCGRRYPEFWGDAGQTPTAALDFFDLKGVVEALLADLHLGGWLFRPTQHAALHPGKSAELVLGSRACAHGGWLGELHPRAAAALGLAGRAVLVAELDLTGLRSFATGRYTYSPVPRFPAALRDIAVIVNEDVPAKRVEAVIAHAGGALLRGVRLFDLYRGDSIPAGTKSLAYALTYQADDRTLKDKEVDTAHKAIEGRLRQELAAQIRGQDA